MLKRQPPVSSRPLFPIMWYQSDHFKENLQSVDFFLGTIKFPIIQKLFRRRLSRRFGSAQVLNGDDSSVNYDSSSPVTSRKPMTSTPKVRYVKECEGCRDIKGRSRLSSSEEFKRPTANQKAQITLTNQKQETQVRTREFNTQTFEPLTHRNGPFLLLR